ncbi:Coronin-7 [Tupaia chinensis]|uniref:Coronin n=1 Tax=Tupaia chinensis TaxID=246437 RepID=L9LB49_TUPCH|nr:Coronin-7 [Tupaia chinensis]
MSGDKAWISDIRAGTAPSCGSHIKSSCSLIAFNSDRPGVLGIVPLESQGEDKRHVAYLGCHSDLLTDLAFSPFDDFLLATGSADRTVKLWRLPASGQALPSVPGVVLGPHDFPVEVLQFHPTADGVLASAAGTAVKVWDAARQQPLTGPDLGCFSTELVAHGDLVQSANWSWDGALLGTACKLGPATVGLLVAAALASRISRASSRCLPSFPKFAVGSRRPLGGALASQMAELSRLHSRPLDKQLRIFDPRAKPQASQSTQAHENGRDGRLVWTSTKEHLVSTGFNQMREREVKLWDTRLFSSALASLTLDTSPGPDSPFPTGPPSRGLGKRGSGTSVKCPSTHHFLPSTL